MPTLESIRPYVEQFFDDGEVQTQLARARANVRRAAGPTKPQARQNGDSRPRTAGG